MNFQLHLVQPILEHSLDSQAMGKISVPMARLQEQGLMDKIKNQVRNCMLMVSLHVCFQVVHFPCGPRELQVKYQLELESVALPNLAQ